MPDHLGKDQRKTTDSKKENFQALDDEDIQILKTYGKGMYNNVLMEAENNIKELQQRVKDALGVEESDLGLADASYWDLASDKQLVKTSPPLEVVRCTKIYDTDTEKPKYMISSHNGKYVVGLGEDLAPVDVEEGMRVGIEVGIMSKKEIKLPLPPKVDPSVSAMQVEEKPDVTYGDVGGCKEQIERLKEVVEMPLLNPEKFIALGIDPPRGVLMYGPPGTGKTLCARAVANKTDACFIRVIGSELVKKYIGEGAKMIRDIFEFARSKKACILFFDEVDAFAQTRFGGDDGGNDNEVQRTMLELINQLDGFEARGNIKVLMATNRPDTLDPAVLRPGRVDRKVEFGLPDTKGRANIFRIHASAMCVEKGIRFELMARMCPNATGAEIRSVCTEAGMFAIRERRKMATEKDFMNAVAKVIKGYSKFSATAAYMSYN